MTSCRPNASIYCDRPLDTASPITVRARRRSNLTLVTSAAVGWLTLLAITVFAPSARVPFRDELAFLDNTRLLQERGMSPAFLLGMHGQAPGPLLNVVHALAAPLTRLELPWVRVIHVLFMPVLIALMYCLIRSVRPDDPISLTLAFVAIPPLWHMSGYMCSDTPTLVFAVAGLILLRMGLKHLVADQSTAAFTAIVIAFAGGICYGTAIVGRATFLGPLALLPLLLCGSDRPQRDAKVLAAFAAAALAISMPVFGIWRGLLPPQHAFLGEGIAPWHLVLNLSYGFFLVVLVAPRWLSLDRRMLTTMITTAVIALVVNLGWLHVTFRPLGSLVPRLLPAPMLWLYDHGMPALLTGLAMGMLLAGSRAARRHRDDGLMLFLLAAGFAMLASAVKITFQYSSSYSLQCLPFLALPLCVGNSVGRWDVVRIVAGMLVGLAAHAIWMATL